MEKYKEQLCWSCKCKHCEWQDDLQPVPGWTAKAVKIKHDNVDTFKITRCPKYVEWVEYKTYYSRFKSKMRQDFTFNRQVYDCLNEKDKKYFYLAYIKRFKNEYIAKLMKCCNTTASRRTQRAFAQYKYFESKLVR